MSNVYPVKGEAYSIRAKTRPQFFIEKRIYYYDTDCGGVVYYANYLKYMEEARTEFFRHKGIDLKELSDKGTLFVVIHLKVDYKSPARYQDKIKIFTNIEEIRYSSIRFVQRIVRGSQTLVIGKTSLACVDSNLKPKLIPEDVKNKLDSVS